MGPIWDVWTHKYNPIGLLSYYRVTGDKKALEASKRAADLMYETFVAKKRSMRLAGAHMGMAATSVLEPISNPLPVYGRPALSRVLSLYRQCMGRPERSSSRLGGRVRGDGWWENL